MHCTRMLHALGNTNAAGIPVDLAMCLTLSRRQPLYQLLSMSPLKATQRLCQSVDSSQPVGLRSPHLSSVPPASQISHHVPSGLRSCLRRYSGAVSKKRVVFADSKGLALTAVRLFVPESTSPSTTQLTKASPTSTRLQQRRLRLGFSQPTLDFKAFLLRDNHVQLESCSVSENSFSGKVYTSHGSTESAAHIRVTFDSWRTQRDIPCIFLHQKRCGTSDIDAFAFDISLPQNVDPKERIEFCVSFRPDVNSFLHWDDNRGQNYRLYLDKDGATLNQGSGSWYHQKFPNIVRLRDL